MPQYYLRVEAMNFGWITGDTHDLSTIRGGGLLALRAPKYLRQQFPAELRQVTAGASVAIFSFEATEARGAAEMERRVTDYLNANEYLRHLTFAVDAIEAPDDEFAAARESLTALNRWKQLQSPTIAPSPPAALNRACSLDRARPASHSILLPNEQGEVTDLGLSEATFMRREYGRREKEDFYREYCANLAPGTHFALDLGDLATCPALKRLNLDEKIAVIHIDGNQFGSLQRHIGSEAEQVAWDTLLQGNRKSILDALVSPNTGSRRWTNPDGRWRARNHNEDHNGPVHRMETLLWGGGRSGVGGPGLGRMGDRAYLLRNGPSESLGVCWPEIDSLRWRSLLPSQGADPGDAGVGRETHRGRQGSLRQKPEHARIPGIGVVRHQQWDYPSHRHSRGTPGRNRASRHHTEKEYASRPTFRPGSCAGHRRHRPFGCRGESHLKIHDGSWACGAGGVERSVRC